MSGEQVYVRRWAFDNSDCPDPVGPFELIAFDVDSGQVLVRDLETGKEHQIHGDDLTAEKPGEAA